MRKRDKKFLGGLLLAALILVSVFFGFVVIGDIVASDLFMINGIQVRGVITSLPEHGPIANLHYAVVRFETKQGEAFESLLPINPETARQGEVVEIAYDPEDPHQIASIFHWRRDFWLCVCVFFLLYAFVRLRPRVKALPYSHFR